jgi:hypothetical protein
MQYDLNEGKTLSISIRNEDWMDINFTSSRNKESFKIRSQLNESKKSKLIVTGNCEYPHRQFSGAWICNLNTKTFVQKFPFLSLIKGDLEGGSLIKVDPCNLNFEIKGTATLKLSSSLVVERTINSFNFLTGGTYLGRESV